jgi:hypothetical protein
LFVTPAQKLLLSKARVNKFLRGNKRFPNRREAPSEPLPHPGKYNQCVLFMQDVQTSERPYEKHVSVARKARKPSCRAALRAFHVACRDVAFDMESDGAIIPSASVHELQAAPPDAPMAGERPKIFFSV